MRVALPALLCLLVKLVAGLPAVAEEPSAERPEYRVARLVRQLGADSYTVRQQADDELSSLGNEARRELQVAAKSDDPEVRLRAKELLRRLRILDLWSPTLVRCQFDAQPAGQALDQLIEQTGNHLLRGGVYGPFSDNNVTVDFAQLPFWQALDEVARQSGNNFRPHLDSRDPGLVLAAGRLGDNPIAYAGPVRAQITGARRTYIEELDYDDMKSDITHSFQINMQVLWEDRFQLVAYRTQPELVEAVTDNGATLAATQSSPTGWNVTGSGTRQLAACLRLHPPPLAARRLDRLVVRWGLIAVGDMAALDVADPAPKKSQCQDDVELTIDEFEQSTAGRYEVSVRIARNLAVPDPQEIVFQENRVELLDAAGQPFKMQSQSNLLTDQGAKLKCSFTAESSDSKPATLRLTYPKLRSQRDLEIVFRDVPLPAGRPD